MTPVSRGTAAVGPPAHSAVKVEGERAYRRARRGETVQTPERTVIVHRFDLLAREGDRAELAHSDDVGDAIPLEEPIGEAGPVRRPDELGMECRKDLVLVERGADDTK